MADRTPPCCGCYVQVPRDRDSHYDDHHFIPLTGVEAHTTIQATASRTRLTQRFVNPHAHAALDALNYVFPLLDGVSVVSFACTVAGRVLRGVFQERRAARQTYDAAVKEGKLAGLLQQSLAASDVFSTRIGNVPPGAEVTVEIVYLAELRHDAEVDGIRFVLPTCFAPRYGPADMLGPSTVTAETGSLSITVDAEMPDGCPITSVQSPSHPIAVDIGRCSTSAETTSPSPRLASATLSLGSSALDRDFVLHVVAPKSKQPSAVLETHPTLPGSHAVLATLVPTFSVPASKPEVVFVCDRSGSMYYGGAVPNLVAALHIFLRSLPVGARFNICSFGTTHEFLWPESRAYDAASLAQAGAHVDAFVTGGSLGGTEMYAPLEAVFERRQRQRGADLDLEVILLTDGEISDQQALLAMVGRHVAASGGAIRLFTLGIGSAVSHALVEGTARVGNGFAQTVGARERMDGKVVRMLRAAVQPHVQFTLEVKYGRDPEGDCADDDDDFVLIEKTLDMLSIDAATARQKDDPASARKDNPATPTPIPIYDESAKEDASSEPAPELPDISPPRHLQTPSPLPTLYPWSRTTVYVLISDAPASLTPRSILLRGTWRHGTLEQEIPITRLPGTGTTVHQLSAHREATELDEGKGWLALAADAETGRPFRDVLGSQYAAAAEREALRLCLRYQVAGRHCSLVAVEEEQQKEGREGREGKAMEQPVWQVDGRDLDIESDDEDMGYALFDGPNIAMPAAPGPVAVAEAVCEEEEESDDDMGFCLGDDDYTGMNPFAPTSKDPLQSLTSLQQFTGSWSWDGDASDTAELERVLGVTRSEAAAKANEAGLDGSRTAVLATVCALVFLRTRLASERDVWQMMADKAADWVAAEVGGEAEYERWQRAVESLF